MVQSFLQNFVHYFALRGFLLILLGALLISKPAGGQQPALNLMPRPSSVQAGTGSLRLDSSFSVALTGYSEPRLERGVERFLERLARQTAISLNSKVAKSGQATLLIRTDHASKEIQEVGEDESYSLEVTPAGAKLAAPTPLGTLHGLQTFVQLVDVSSDSLAAPAVTIQDRPRFPWRGLMIDSARHFTPLDVIRRNLDGMEALKLDVFHWHLSDNQGFRVESKSFPKLQELGSAGLYYTQVEIRDVIAYARDRGIRVVPEFDMPGHSTSWFVGYPELASAPGPYEIERRWGVFDAAMDPTKESTYKFLDRFIEEMAKLFPDQFFHVGGDEVNGKQWDANKEIQEFMRAHGIQNNQALQAYFNKRLQPIVEKHGKSMIGWDEILDPTLPKDITVQSWRGQASLAAAAKQGYRGILSNGYYLDLGWPASRLECLGLTHKTSYWQMLHRIAGAATPDEFAALHTLTDQLEPVKDYTREQTAPAEPTSLTPMNRVVDAVPLESAAGRRFGELVDKFIAVSCLDTDAGARLRRQFTAWRDNDGRLEPLAKRSFLVREVAERSRDLSALGTIGLAALDAIAKRQPAPGSWKTRQLATIEQLKKQKAQLMLLPAPAVQKLVEAAAAGGPCMAAK